MRVILNSVRAKPTLDRRLTEIAELEEADVLLVEV